jgi:protein-L-isoaspartate(D-aspartate) O-methyltransferase
MEDPRFLQKRHALIETIRERGIEDLEILHLFDTVPRHLFVPEAVWGRAYEDTPLPIGFGQTASQPSLQAYYVSVLHPGPQDRVLEIGTGSGFLTAILARVSDRVYSVDRVRELSVRARKALDLVGVQNVALMVGDGTIGWRKFAPFDVIVVSAASPGIPKAYIDQLADGGRMLIPVGSRESQRLVLVSKTDSGAVEETVLVRCTFVPLIGEFGWPAEVRGEA